MDKLVISGIKLYTLIGAHPWEQKCRQNIVLDLAFQTDAKRIAEHDDLNLAIDYDRLLTHIIELVESHHFQLIETLAEHIAQEILEHFATKWVQITLHKPGALKQAKDVAIIIERVAA